MFASVAAGRELVDNHITVPWPSKSLKQALHVFQNYSRVSTYCCALQTAADVFARLDRMYVLQRSKLQKGKRSHFLRGPSVALNNTTAAIYSLFCCLSLFQWRTLGRAGPSQFGALGKIFGGAP